MFFSKHLSSSLSESLEALTYQMLKMCSYYEAGGRETVFNQEFFCHFQRVTNYHLFQLG
jgi:hypothetical protein